MRNQPNTARSPMRLLLLLSALMVPCLLIAQQSQPSIQPTQEPPTITIKDLSSKKKIRSIFDAPGAQLNPDDLLGGKLGERYPERVYTLCGCSKSQALLRKMVIDQAAKPPKKQRIEAPTKTASEPEPPAPEPTSAPASQPRAPSVIVFAPLTCDPKKDPLCGIISADD
jgi:hypothetical protein